MNIKVINTKVMTKVLSIKNPFPFYKSLYAKNYFFFIGMDLLQHLRSKWLLCYTAILFIFSTIVLLSNSSQFFQSIISLLNLSLLIVPLFSLLYGAISFSESLPFMELILIRNFTRRMILFGKFISLSLGLSLSYCIGIAASLPFLSSINFSILQLFLILGILSFFLHFIFIALSYFLAITIKRKEMMMGIALMLWFYFYIFYDILVIFLATFLKTYPLEYPILFLILLNPIDLVRISILLQLDISNVMGFSTALIQHLLGGKYGLLLTMSTLSLWAYLIYQLTLRKFMKKELS